MKHYANQYLKYIQPTRSNQTNGFNFYTTQSKD
jgi:hypothetical protein